mmetsp:Transcript_43906/g.105932  ORF Transcript_43906/g.105932 Transcript_43906/m.105932 type:complete len:1160 (-) Transcript_43906:45-3524(-)
MIMVSNPSGMTLSLLLALITCWDKNHHQWSAQAFDYQGGVSCSTDSECEDSYRKGSFCLASGVCSNPYHSGCLNNLFPDDDQYTIRHCNSHDDEIEDAKCRISKHLYPEINIYNQDWEVALFFSWIYQIVLSEVLNVPVRVGLGRTSANLTTKGSLETSNFYSLETILPSMDGPSYPWHAIRKANEMGGDCSLTQDDCIHVIPDVWMGQRSNYEQEYEDGQIDYLDGNGQVGKTSWYVPKRTAQRYPFTVTYLGLSENRELLAEIFHRPVTWRDYCHEVSATNCSQPDEVALRYPETEELGHKYFWSDGYIGHFRPTDKNNCTIIDTNATRVTAMESNLTCTGHIVNAKCSWSTFLESQAYWNNIALESNGPDWINGGYSYDDIVDIWRAANATDSDVISYFFEPDFASEEFRTTDYEYTKVILPTATIQCRDSRVPPSDRCSEDSMVRRGVEVGSCDDNAHATKKVVAMSFRDTTMASPDAYQSPAYAFIRNFNMDELELSQLLRVFSASGQTGHAAREAVCEWIGNNMDYISRFVPPSHPRDVKARSNKGEVVDIIAIAVGASAVVLVLLATIQMYKLRKKKVFMYAQVTFIFVVLFGLLLVAISSILYVIQPNDVVCTMQIWLVAMGFTCMLVPLIIKVSAMNSLMRASKRMRRIKIKPKALYAKVLGWLVFVTIYLMVWTAVDPPRPIQMRSLEEDRTTIYTETGCMSSSEYWLASYLGWEMILALAAFILAFQSRKAKAEFNESKSLGFMIYSHLGFASLRIIVFNVFDEDDVHLESLGTSFFLSLDVILAVTIYLLPKFLQCNTFEATRSSNDVQGSATVQQIELQAASSNFQRFRRSSIRVLFGAQKSLTDDTDLSDLNINNTDRETGKISIDLDSQNEQENETDAKIERAKEPIVREEDNDLSSAARLRHRVAGVGGRSPTHRSPTRRSPNSGEFGSSSLASSGDFRPNHRSPTPRSPKNSGEFGSSSGDFRFRPGFRKTDSSRSSMSFGSGGGARTSFSSAGGRRPSLAESVSKYGRTSIQLLFGPATVLEVIQSERDLPEINWDDSSEEGDLGRISEDEGRISQDGDFDNAVEVYAELQAKHLQESNGSCGELGNVVEGDAESPTKNLKESNGGSPTAGQNLRTALAKRTKSGDSVTSVQRKNEHVMAA